MFIQHFSKVLSISRFISTVLKIIFVNTKTPGTHKNTPNIHGNNDSSSSRKRGNLVNFGQTEFETNKRRNCQTYDLKQP